MTESSSKNQPSNCTEYLLKAQIIAWLKESLASESINEEVKQRIIVKFCVQIEGGNQSIENLEEVEEKLEPGLPRGMVGTTGDPPHPTADPPHHTDDPPHSIVDSSTTIVWLEKSLASEPIDEEVKSQILDKFRAQMELEYQSLPIGCNPGYTSDPPNPIEDTVSGTKDKENSEFKEKQNSNPDRPQPNTEN